MIFAATALYMVHKKKIYCVVDFSVLSIKDNGVSHKACNFQKCYTDAFLLIWSQKTLQCHLPKELESLTFSNS